MNDNVIFVNPDGKFNSVLQNEAYELQRILSDSDALSIYLVSTNKEHTVEVVFEAYIEYFCHRSKRVMDLSTDKRELFSMIVNSAIFYWLEKESCGTFSLQLDSDAKHFQINTENDVIDVVTYNFMKVNVLDPLEHATQI
jgi:hypothetical protein